MPDTFCILVISTVTHRHINLINILIIKHYYILIQLILSVMYKTYLKYVKKYVVFNMILDHRGRDCMVVGFTTTYAISAYHH